MYVVVVTNNYNDKGEAILCKTKDDGIKELKEKFLTLCDEAINLNRHHTHVSADLLYAEVWDGLLATEMRVLPAVGTN